MEKLKEFLSFPLFATVLWLIWVLANQIGSAAWIAAGTMLLVLSLAIWIVKFQSRWIQVFGWIIGVVAIGFAVQWSSNGEAAATSNVSNANSPWHSYDKTKIDETLSAGRAVFIDFTAAWCITCQVNKRAVLETAEAEKIFADHDVYLVRADWTKQDAAITAALALFGRNSVPVYAYYAKGKTEAQILPQILTMSMIRDLFP